jgi:cytidine deaminase
MATESRSAPEFDLKRLLDACRNTLLSCTNELVRVSAGVLDSRGRIFTSVQVRSRNCNHCSVCAEAIAIGIALSAGSTELIACAALVRTEDGIDVWSPCGSCRELLRDHRVGQAVVSASGSHVVTARTVDLLPWP